MKKHGIIILCILYSVSALFASEFEAKKFSPSTPRITAMGGGGFALPVGLEAFYTNPAALAFNKGSFTILSLTPTLYCEPKYAVDLLTSITGTKNPLSGMLLASKQMITGSGAGASADVGIGWTGNRWGLAFLGNVVTFFQGEPFPLGVNGAFNAVMSLAGGYAMPFYFTDTIKMSIGVSLRPMNAYYVLINGETVDMIIGNPEQANTVIKEAFTVPFFTLATDVGFQVFFGSHFVLAAAIRDIGPAFSSPNTNRVQIPNPASINAGIGYLNEFNLFFFNMRVILTADITNINELAEGTTSFWKTLHFGSEFAIQDSVFFRAGLNQGYFTCGLGIKLWFLELGASFYTMENGRYLGDMPLSAVKIDVTIKL